MSIKRKLTAGLLALVTVGGPAVVGVSPADASRSDERARPYEVTVTITNLAPEDGTNQTPFWIGIHDGSFDLYDRDAPASPELERIAEDGNIDPLFAAFADSGAGIDGAAPGPNGPIAPGERAEVSFFVSPQRGESQYLSYASMVLPSNDAFVANGDPLAHRIFNQRGRFIPRSFVVRGSEVLDAGTEENDELPANTAFFGQQTPDTGVVEGGVVTLHPGFNDPAAGGNILADPRFANADFTADGYNSVRIDVTAKRLQNQLRTRLSGTAEVPAIDTDARGNARVRLERDGDIDFRIRARRIDDVRFAHIHLGRPGENGPVAVTLFTGDLTNNRNQLDVRGEISDSDLVGPLEGMTTLELWQEILAGNAYINVHSDEFPAGELRGNL